MDREEQIRKALARLIDIDKTLEEAKKLYDERDALTLALRDLAFAETVHEGKRFTLCDNFAQKNVCYRMAFVRRWEVKIKEVKEAK
jgi:CO dehydrogenase/acetyl-CoA synthase beta subunit